MHAKSLQSCLTVCHPMDGSLPGFSVHEILQARILEWVAMPSSRGSSWTRDRTRISYVSRTSRQVFFTTSSTWLYTAVAKSLQSCLTLCDPIDGSPPGAPVPGILQARTLEWVALSFSNAWKWKVKVKSLSRIRLLTTPWTAAYQAPPSMGFSRQEYWNGVPLPSPDGILLSHKKEWNLAICNSMDGLRGHNAKWNKSQRKRQILYNCTFIRNLKNKTSEKT